MADLIYIPDDIVHNILSRLPGKPLLRFRCVSKHWNRLISDPYFMKSRSRRMIILKYPQPLVVLDENVPVNDKVHSMVKVPSLIEYQRSYIVGTSDGLVILVLTDMFKYSHMILYNPLTRASKTLVVMDPPFKDGKIPYVFGFDKNESKVVRFEEFDHPTQARTVYKCDVFDLKTSLWSTRPQFFKTDFYFWGDGGIFLDGFLYWLFSLLSMGIVALNVKEMTISFIALPHGRDAKKFGVHKSDYSFLRLGTLDGCLCMISKTDTITFDVWAMKEHGVQNSWLKTFSFTFGVEGTCFSEFHPMCILSHGKILLKNGSNQIVIYDTSKDSYKTLNNVASLDDFDEESMQGYLRRVLPVEYVESFVSPHYNKIIL